MGGKVLTLESERLRAEGRAEGRVEGGNLMIYTLVQNGEITPETGAKQLKITVEELKNKMLLTGFSFPEWYDCSL